jgi:hypothetical protein
VRFHRQADDTPELRRNTGRHLYLIGTSTNLIVHGMVLSSTDLPPMGFSEIGALGLPSAAVGILIIVLAGRWLLRAQTALAPAG